MWPENWDAYVLFTAMDTQRRENGAMDFGTLPVVMRMMDLGRTATERGQLFDDMRIMDGEHLTIMAKRREAAQ